eukprot:CAMPEP_0206274606 /NCGR_PEP_ID=MMETSP0047_2-20121206/35253_1 /ASSEMBLY_ACC=CAM_ASM_000192 /TAXON_ID=195065 /ORGANISM="Chroomonas mesostigmatica_cf, Strain CCMP1168" /LENGTH=130 /DNA_ID=CAMNT_0053703849 /DNA_START=410 /DNA_END=802 /DNA_ORIENTATION=-
MVGGIGEEYPLVVCPHAPTPNGRSLLVGRSAKQGAKFVPKELNGRPVLGYQEQVPEEEDRHEAEQRPRRQQDEARLPNVSAPSQVGRRERVDAVHNPPKDAHHEGLPAQGCAVHARHPHAEHPRDKVALV